MTMMKDYNFQFSELDAIDLADLLGIMVVKTKIENADFLSYIDEVL